MVFRPLVRDQRIGKVATISLTKVSNEIEQVERTAASWFDGTRASIESRIARLRSATAGARQLVMNETDEDLTMYRKARLQDFIGKAEREVRDLERTASEFVDVETQEALQALPTYRIAVAGARDLGERTAAPRTKADMQLLRRGSELHEFLAVEPKAFVRENGGLSRSQMRTAAVSYVQQKTAAMTNNVTLRTQVVEEFVRRVELLAGR